MRPAALEESRLQYFFHRWFLSSLSPFRPFKLPLLPLGRVCCLDHECLISAELLPAWVQIPLVSHDNNFFFSLAPAVQIPELDPSMVLTFGPSLIIFKVPAGRGAGSNPDSSWIRRWSPPLALH